MQWVDASLWYLRKQGDTLGAGCSTKSAIVNIFGVGVIILEPIACLFGSMYARKKWFTRNEFLFYIVGNFSVQFLMGYVFIQEECYGTRPCPTLTNDQHLLLCIGVDKNGGPQCWREFGFFGSPSYEIPVWLRACFLLGMVYPYLAYYQPLGSGIIQSTVLIVAWTAGYMSDSHASVWCLANVAQVVTMYMDPFWFPPPSLKVPNLRDFYNTSKSKGSDYDYVIVGSGIGGLSTGALLARAGYRVLMLEQHYRVGGCTHEFKQRGDYFDSGIHYVGNSLAITSMLSFITDKPGVALAPMGSAADGFLYDEFDLGEGLIVKFRAGRKQLRDELLKHFPEENKGINIYFNRLEQAQASLAALVVLKALPNWLIRMSFVKKFLIRRISNAASVTATHVVNDCVSDPRLRALLSAGQLIDWNLKPDECSWAVVGGMANYYISGAAYPVGGSSKIAERVVPVIERSGGKVLVKARVKEFIVANGRVTGVKMQNGDEIFAKHAVISDIGIVNTFKCLPDEILKKHKFSREIPGVQGSNGHMTAFINLDGPPSNFDLRAANIHSWTDLPKYNYDPNALQQAFYDKPLETAAGALMTLTCPCVKDPQYVIDQPDQSNVLLLTEAKWEWFKDMDLEEVKSMYDEASTSTHGNRCEAYRDFKKQWESIFLERLYHYYPKTRGHVNGVQIGTPVSSAHFIAADHGASYGLASTPEHFSEDILANYLSIQSRIPGLFLTGESALFGGFAGAMAGGYLCALKLLGFFNMAWILLKTESIDADREHVKKLHPGLDEASSSMLLAVFASLVGVLLSGRRFGKSLAAVLAKSIG